MGQAEIHTQIDINAPIERVWEVLTDWPAYIEWNPWIQFLSGELKVGARLEARITLAGRLITLKPQVTRVQPGEAFSWLGHTIFVGVFDGEHSFELKALDAHRTRFVHSERFGGLAARFLLWRIGDVTEKGWCASWAKKLDS